MNDDVTQRTQQVLSGLSSAEIEEVMRMLRHPAWKTGENVLAARACIGLGLLPTAPVPSANRVERAVRLEVPAEGDPLATQGRDLGRLLSFAAREIIEGCAAAPIAPEGLRDFRWYVVPHGYQSEGVHVHEPRPRGVEIVSGELPVELPRITFVRPQMAGEIKLVDFCGVPHTLDWQLGWDTAAHVGVLWFGPRALHPNHHEAL